MKNLKEKRMKDNNYIDGKTFYCEMVLSKNAGRLTKRAENMMILIGRSVIKRMTYYDEDLRKDCLQQGLYSMFKNWYSFDENKGTNAFAYFTEVFKRGTAIQFNSWKAWNHDCISIEGSNDGMGLHSI